MEVLSHYESIMHAAAMIERKAGRKKLIEALDPAEPLTHVHSMAGRSTA